MPGLVASILSKPDISGNVMTDVVLLTECLVTSDSPLVVVYIPTSSIASS